MGTEESKDPFKGVDWKAVGNDMQKDPGAKAVMKKRLPRKIRQIPECYFLPRKSIPSMLAFYGACIAGGVGAGMLLEIWINKKVKGIYLTKKQYSILIAIFTRFSRVSTVPNSLNSFIVGNFHEWKMDSACSR